MNKNKLWIRALCIALAALMVIGIGTTAIFMLINLL